MKRRVPSTSYVFRTLLFLTIGLYATWVLPKNTWGLETQQGIDNNGNTINKDIITGIDLLYDNKFDESENLFQKIVVRFPEKPVGYFYLAMVTWSRLAFGFWAPETVMEYRKRIDKTILVARRRVENNTADSYDFFYLGGALGFKGRFELMKGDWLSAFFLARDSIDAFETCLKMDPGNKDVLLGFGTFDYYTAHMSGVLKILTYLLVHKGNKEEGLRKLHIAAREATYSATEAKSMLIHIYLFVEEDFLKAMKLADELTKKYKQDPLYSFLLGVCYIRLGMDREYRNTVNLLRQRSLQAETLSEAGLWGRRALYLETVYDLFQKQYQAARGKLKDILYRQDPLNDPAMIAWPLMKMGISYDLEGNREVATQYYREVLTMENGSGAQFLAKKLLRDPIKKNDPFIGY